MSKVVICSAHDEKYTEMANITLPSVVRYCMRHDYMLHYDPHRDPKEGDACKILLFKQLYESGQFQPDDIFFWIDTDAIIMDSEKSIRKLISQATDPAYGQPHYIIGYDFNGINTGTWLATFSSQAYHLLMVAQSRSISMGWADQEGLIQTMVQEPFASWVEIVPGKLMNAMPYELYGWENLPHKNLINNYEPGDFIIHLPGIELSKRMELLAQYAAEAK